MGQFSPSLETQYDKKRRPKSFSLFTDIVRQLENTDINTNIIILQFFAVKHIANYPASRGPSIFLDGSREDSKDLNLSNRKQIQQGSYGLDSGEAWTRGLWITMLLTQTKKENWLCENDNCKITYLPWQFCKGQLLRRLQERAKNALKKPWIRIFVVGFNFPVLLNDG